MISRNKINTVIYYLTPARSLPRFLFVRAFPAK